MLLYATVVLVLLLLLLLYVLLRGVKMDKNIKVFCGQKAVEKIRSIPIECDEMTLFINQWAKDTGIFSFIYYHDETPVSFILFSSMLYDPLNIHKKPRTLNFIYTLRNFRRGGYASKLIKFSKEHVEFTAFCVTDISENIFKKSGCQYYGLFNGLPMYRS